MIADKYLGGSRHVSVVIPVDILTLLDRLIINTKGATRSGLIRDAIVEYVEARKNFTEIEGPPA